MTLTISPALDAPEPLRFPPDLRITPEQFELVCAENREAVLELVGRRWPCHCDDAHRQ